MIGTRRFIMFEKLRPLAIVIAIVLNIAIKDVNGKPPSKIVGGSDANIEDYPSMVSIRFGGGHHCGGTLITRKHVLTAAHCVLQYDQLQDRYRLKMPAFLIDVFAGIQHKSESSESRRYSVDSNDVHPDFSGYVSDKGKNDIAILTLTKPVAISDTVKPISLPTKDTPQGAVGYTIGWGAVTSSSKLPADGLNKLKITIDDTTRWCPESTFQLCGARADNTGVCEGDSGSALIIDNEVVGITSYAVGCASPAPDRFTRVYHYLSWINEIINN